MVPLADFQPTKPSIHYESEHPSHVRVMSSYAALLFLKHCPDISYQKLCQLLSACGHTLVCLWVCLRGAEGVRNLANCCLIFGTLAPSLQRASLKSVGSLHPIPPPCSDSGSRAKPGSAGLTDCSQSSSTKPAGPVACARPSTHSTTPHYTTHRWLDHLLEIIVTGVQQVFQGIPPSPGKQRSDSAAGLRAHVCAAY